MFEEYRYIGIYERKLCRPKHFCHLIVLLHIQSRILRDLINARSREASYFSAETFFAFVIKDVQYFAQCSENLIF